MSRIVLALALASVVTGCGLVIGLESSYEAAPPATVEAGTSTDDGAAGDAACGTGGCKECVPGDFRCIGVELQQCASGFFKPLETCASADKCSATGGNCAGIFCTPGQRRCSQDRLERCNAAQTAFEVELTCGIGLCDALQKRCNKCIPSTNIGCFNPQTIEHCSDDGQTTNNVACVQPKPNCVTGASGTACLECGNDSQCSTTADCRAPQCVNGTCGTKADPAQEGRILIAAPQMSCTQVVCKSGLASQGFLPQGTKCGDGQGFSYYCKADGSCAAEQ